LLISWVTWFSFSQSGCVVSDDIITITTRTVGTKTFARGSRSMAGLPPLLDLISDHDGFFEPQPAVPNTSAHRVLPYQMDALLVCFPSVTENIVLIARHRLMPINDCYAAAPRARLTSVCLSVRLSRTSWIFMTPTATGSKACWAPQARRKACMGWIWATACGLGLQGRGHIVRHRAQLVTTSIRRPFDCLSKVIKVTVTLPASRSHADLFIMPRL